MIVLTKHDIISHSILASDLDDGTIKSIISSISSEYQEVKDFLTKKERLNYSKLLNIYVQELMLRHVNYSTISSTYH
jgi:hypothetical protein